MKMRTGKQVTPSAEPNPGLGGPYSSYQSLSRRPPATKRGRLRPFVAFSPIFRYAPPAVSASPTLSPSRHVTLCVTGSIAAYKAVSLARLLRKQGVLVDAVLTRAATRFVGPLTFSAITGRPTHVEMFDGTSGGESHVTISGRTDLVVVAPATADTLARMAAGRCDDLVTATVLCSSCPVLVAPAMHPRMWSHPATCRNLATLMGDGRVVLVGPEEGEVASGESGRGRMSDPERIAEEATRLLEHSVRSLVGRKIVVTAGPTVEDIDPVRMLTNRSSGKMGFALARAAAENGAAVTLLAGPVELPTPPGVTRVNVRSALDLRAALWDALGPNLTGCDAVFMAAAVGDFRPPTVALAKLARGSEALSLTLVPNPDILAEIGARRGESGPLLIGFALETGTETELLERARKKREKKGVDLIVANHASESMGLDTNRVFVIDAHHPPLSLSGSKDQVASRLMELLAERLGSRS